MPALTVGHCGFVIGSVRGAEWRPAITRPCLVPSRPLPAPCAINGSRDKSVMACAASADRFWVRLKSRNSEGRGGYSWRCERASPAHSDSNQYRRLVLD